MSERNFDVVVIGAGPAGEICAGRIADGGLKVAIVESELIGGECSYYACMPSKALLRPSELLDEAKRVPGSSQAADGELDPQAVLARRDEVIHDLDDSGQLPWLEQKGIELFRGEGKLDGERRVAVGDEILSASKAVVVAAGTMASIPPIDGLDDLEPWDNREGTTAKEVPESLIVLGGGPVGCELAQAWSTLGSEVTLLEPMERLLAREEPFAGEQVAEALRERHGVTVITGAETESARRTEDGGAELTLKGGQTVSARTVMVAAGRRPRTKGIGIEQFGLEANKPIEVDAQLRVKGHDWLFAVGDVNGRAPLTHMGKYQARAAADVILGKDAGATAEDLGSPRVTFTDPQVAAVGLTLEQATEKGLNAKAVDQDSSGTAGASFQGKEQPGTSRLVIDEDRRIIVGATFSGFETADWLHAATVAIVGEVPLETLWHAIPAYPTRSEIWLKLMEEYGL